MAVRIKIVGEKNRLLPVSRERKRVSAALADRIVPAIQATLPGQLIPDHFPWCFVLPPFGKKGRFYVGALINRDETCLLPALYAAVSASWLQKELASNFHIAFWLARIMAAWQGQGEARDDSVLKRWLDLLTSHYSPLRGRLLNDSYKFSSHSALLLAGLCECDETVTAENGVDRMPWRGWPDNLQAGNRAWLWRQSRYGKIIDSQQIIW